MVSAPCGTPGGRENGKSTLARLLELVFTSDYGWNVARLSIDDFYLTRAEREQLARDVHPLLRTRGVPGTHDIALLTETLHRLSVLQNGEGCVLPRFDKATDDRAREDAFDMVSGPVDAIILEGWCLGFTSAGTDLESGDEYTPASGLERQHDPEGVWRRFVSSNLHNNYQQVFDGIDKLVFLRAPDFTSVRRWRNNQETRLAEVAAGGDRVMSDEELDRFMMLFERLTLANVDQLTASADEVFFLDEAQAIQSHKARHN